MDSLTQFIADALAARGHSTDSAKKMAEAVRAFDRKRHCGALDITDASDRETVEAFIEGALFMFKELSP